jgi:hypothetical protein
MSAVGLVSAADSRRENGERPLGRAGLLVPIAATMAQNSSPRAAANPAWVGAENGRC